MTSRSYKIENYSSFRNSIWRSLISDVCKRVDKNKMGLRVISPFGFELLENKNFLNKSIKRLYCYIGLPRKISHYYDKSVISKEFSEKLLSSMEEIGINTSEIAILVTQDKFTLFHGSDYQCKQSDKLIDIQTRIIDEDILTDYANYIICTIDSIGSEKDEPKHFSKNKRHRCRTYQLYVMLEKLFSYLLPPMPPLQNILFNGVFKFIDNSIQMFYTPSELNIPASVYEIDLLYVLIKPRVELMRYYIQLSPSPEDLIKIQCDAYHVEANLELILNKYIYKSAVQKIRTTYLHFSN